MDCFDAVDWLAAHHDKVPPRGCEFRVSLRGEHLGLFLRISNCASWGITGLCVEQDAFCHRGYQGAVQGLLLRAYREVEASKGIYPKAMHVHFDRFLTRVNSMLGGEGGECELSVRDTSGLSMVGAELQLALVSSLHFQRTVADEKELRLREEAYFEFPTMRVQLGSVDEVADLVRGARRVVALTGAGISVESGITPFRNPSDGDSGSLWGKFDAQKMTNQNFNSDPEITRAWWLMKRSIRQEIAAARPNPAHEFFGALDRAGKLSAVITQNIDSMHQRGGVRDENIIELHGDMRRIICSDHKTSLNLMPFRDGRCSFTCAWADIDEAAQVPACPLCGCPLRTETVMFSQPMPRGVMAAATEAVASADLLVVVGSTLVVEPANNLPAEALCRRTPVIMINFDATKYDAHVTALVRQKAGAFLGEVAAKLEQSGVLQRSEGSADCEPCTVRCIACSGSGVLIQDLPCPLCEGVPGWPEVST